MAKKALFQFSLTVKLTLHQTRHCPAASLWDLRPFRPHPFHPS
jgi:hypothetical protein